MIQDSFSEWNIFRLISNGANPFIASYSNGFIPLHIAAGFTEGTLSCDVSFFHLNIINYSKPRKKFIPVIHIFLNWKRN